MLRLLLNDDFLLILGMPTLHVPILKQPIVDALIYPFLQLSKDAQTHWLIDCTLGGGGHTAAFLDAFQKNPQLGHHKILAMDRDLSAIQNAQSRFQSAIEQGHLELVHARFGDLLNVLENRPVLALMADLGFSSDQLGDANRGLSFQAEGPLDMRLDLSQGMSCRDFLARVTEKELENILRELGEERFSRRIASAIIDQRGRGQLPATTQQLAEIVIRAIPSSARHGRIHAATRTFQALRIAVNDELSELDALLEGLTAAVQPQGRIAILSFHSLEDRKVKQQFKKRDFFSALTKKPVQADEIEIQLNPRSRSAKLRIAERRDRC